MPSSLNFGYDPPLGGYWGDIIPLDDNPDELPSHEFPESYPFWLPQSFDPIEASFRRAGYTLPETAIAAMVEANEAGLHSIGDARRFAYTGDEIKYTLAPSDWLERGEYA